MFSAEASPLSLLPKFPSILQSKLTQTGNRVKRTKEGRLMAEQERWTSDSCVTNAKLEIPN
jgi:hypothetical protein